MTIQIKWVTWKVRSLHSTNRLLLSKVRYKCEMESSSRRTMSLWVEIRPLEVLSRRSKDLPIFWSKAACSHLISNRNSMRHKCNCRMLRTPLWSWRVNSDNPSPSAPTSKVKSSGWRLNWLRHLVLWVTSWRRRTEKSHNWSRGFRNWKAYWGLHNKMLHRSRLVWSNR